MRDHVVVIKLEELNEFSKSHRKDLLNCNCYLTSR